MGHPKPVARGQEGLFGSRRMQMDESIEMTIASLQAYMGRYNHVAVAWSGGKDSTCTVTLLLWLILSGKVPAPKTLRILYADTRAELHPLWVTAQRIMSEMDGCAEDLAKLGCALTVETVMAPLDERYMVYMLGRGVPPPNSNTLRWCTAQIKIEPMERALAKAACDLGLGEMVTGKRGSTHYRGFGDEKILVLTGVRQGESAVRDGRITLSCGKAGSECGQGWYQETLPTALCDTLAPLLHWRICHVWAWLFTWAPEEQYGGWSTRMLAEAYGGRDGDEAAESQARTGCNGCPLAERDSALDGVLTFEQWAYLAPLKRLRPLYRKLREPMNRLRKPGGETRKDLTLVANQHRMGPIKLEARLAALDEVLAIQREINEAARAQRRPEIDILNAEEEARVRELIAAGTWPQRWTGDEPGAEEWFEETFADGTAQPTLFSAAEM